MQINIRNGTVIIDDEDFHLFKKYTYRVTTFSGGKKYACRSFNFIKPCGKRSCKTIMLHWDILNHKPLKSIDVDHVNGNGLDNRKDNLRILSRSANIHNQNINTPCFISYMKRSNSFQVTVFQKYIGHSTNIDEAIKIRNNYIEHEADNETRQKAREVLQEILSAGQRPKI